MPSEKFKNNCMWIAAISLAIFFSVFLVVGTHDRFTRNDAMKMHEQRNDEIATRTAYVDGQLLDLKNRVAALEKKLP